jgi:hypothetical protein
MSQAGGFVLWLLRFTFGLVIVLFVISFIPGNVLGDVAAALGGAVVAILGAVPDIIHYVTSRLSG